MWVQVGWWLVAATRYPGCGSCGWCGAGPGWAGRPGMAGVCLWGCPALWPVRWSSEIPWGGLPLSGCGGSYMAGWPALTRRTGLEPGTRAQHTMNRGTGTGAKENLDPTPVHRTYSQWVAGPGRTLQGRVVGRGRRARQGPPPGALLPPQQRGKPARQSARCGDEEGSPRPDSPHPQPVGSGPQTHAPRTGGWKWESAEPRTPDTQAGRALPRAPRCRAHSAQSQHTRARSVGLQRVPTPTAHRTHSWSVAGPGRTPQGQVVGRGRAPGPGRFRVRRETLPPRRPRAAPTAHKASSQERALWGW